MIPIPDLKNINDLKGLLQNFFNHHVLDKTKLREYLIGQIEPIDNAVFSLIESNPQLEKWQAVKDLAILSKDDVSISAINQIIFVPHFIRQFKSYNLNSQENFELAIKLKAAEISSGDQIRDYFTAEKIKNDQLLATLYVLCEAINHLERLSFLEIKDVLKHPSYHYFGQKSLDDRIYEVALKLYEARLKLKLV